MIGLGLMAMMPVEETGADYDATVLWGLEQLGNCGVLVTDEDLAITGWNPWLELHSKRAARSVLGRKLFEVCPEILARRLDGLYRQAASGQVAILSQRFHGYLLRLPPEESGETTAPMPQSVRIVPRIEGGRVTGTITFIEDVTDRVAQDAELRHVRGDLESATADRERALATAQTLERQWQAMLDAIGEGVCLLDGSGQVRRCNPAFRRLVRRPDEAFVGRALADLWPETNALLGTALLELNRGQERSTFEWTAADQWIRVTADAIRNPDGGLEGATLILNDVSEQRHAEQVLRLRDRAIQSSSQGILITDPTQPDNPIVFANQGFERLTGYPVVEILGRNCRFLQGPDTDPATVARLRETVRGERACAVELLNYRKDGTAFWNALTISPIRSDAGQVTHFVGVSSDVSERRRLDDQLRQTQKMEAIGRLAGGIAHDFNNLMTVVNGFSELVLGQLPAEAPSRIPVQQIKKAGERAAALTQQLLALSRKEVVQPRQLDLNVVVADLVPMLKRTLGEDIELTTVTEPALGRILADPSQLVQVLLNLTVNARDAMPQGGKLTIETRSAHLRTGYTTPQTEVAAGRYVRLTVSDTGAGMSPETRARIFEPFFTTKEFGKGTGLGLATVYGVVKQAGGHIDVASELDIGTTFHVYFPQLDDAALDQPAPPAATSAPSGSETILLVEDEETVRSFVSLILQEFGYAVLIAANGAEALRLAVAHPEPIHLLVTDVVMPQMSGRQLAEALRTTHPETKVIYVSGYTDDAIVRHGIVAAETNFLQKPFSRPDLGQKIRAVLDACAG